MIGNPKTRQFRLAAEHDRFRDEYCRLCIFFIANGEINFYALARASGFVAEFEREMCRILEIVAMNVNAHEVESIPVVAEKEAELLAVSRAMDHKVVVR